MKVSKISLLIYLLTYLLFAVDIILPYVIFHGRR